MSESTEAKSSGSASSSAKWPTVAVFKELHTLIGSVKEIGTVATMDEVLEGMKRYILNKRLFDPNNPFRVCCKDDKLGSVLGVEEFTIAQVKTLLTKVVTPVPYSKLSDSSGASSQSESLSKRKLEEESSEQRKVFLADVSSTSSPMKLFIPPTPEYCCESDDNSLQGYETALVRDTSDTSVDGIYQVEDIYDIEYEVESVVSDFSDNDDSSCCSASDISDSEVMLNAALVTFLCRTDSDAEFFADDSSDEEDEEISEFDHWECNRCHSLNRPPMRYCARCWEERREWLPDGGARQNNPPPRRRKSKNRFLKEASLAEGGALLKCDQDATSVVLSPEEDIPAPPGGAKLCIICCNKPANASIVHAKYAHQVTCYRCARKLQKQGKRCPICRRHIDRVVHQIAS